MSDGTISKIQLPNNNVYDVVDNTSGYITVSDVHNIPSGGTSGQVLTKHSATDYDVSWADASGGGAYIVTFTWDDEEQEYTCDKTSQEICEAGFSDKNVVGVCYDDDLTSGTFYTCEDFYKTVEGSITYYYAHFSSLNYSTDTIGAENLYISNDGVRTYYESVEPVPKGRTINNKDLYSDIILTASDVGALPDTTTIPSKTSDLTNDSGFITGMEILSYGNSTWQNFIDAYNANKVVYCRASSNSNPASGSQTRLAFMAYVNNATTPTEVEFQYYRSVSTHTASQQGDQVYVYKLNKTNGWSVTVREASVKVVAGTGLSGTYSNGTMTLTAPHDTTKQDILVSGTNIKTINNTSLLGSGDITISAEAGIFVCEYGVTTSADALVAYNAGKRLVCHYNNSLLDFYAWLEAYDSENTYFEFEVTSGDKHMEFYLDSNGWTRDEYSASAIPIARRISKFNSDARMNSMDMTSSEIEDFVEDLDMGASGLLNMFYPVGSIYQTVDDGFNPNTRWGGTWELIEEGRFLQATETSQTGGDTVSAGLPNITGYVLQRSTNYNTGNITWTGGGALAVSNATSTADGLSQVNGALAQKRIDFDASISNSIYGNSTTVQPPAIKVYMWYRTA